MLTFDYMEQLELSYTANVTVKITTHWKTKKHESFLKC